MIEVDITGQAAIKAMLGEFTDPQLTKRSSRATKAAAQVFAAPLRAAVEPLSKRMARSVWVHVARREKPAYVVGHHSRIAFFWHMVIGGTKAHSTSARNGSRTGPFVRGVPPHPVIERVANTYAEQAYRAYLADISKDA